MSQSILITGSSRGFGRLSAESLARKGHHVVATMRGVAGKNSETAQELKRFAETEQLRIDVIELDVTDNDSVDAAVRTAIERAGRIDVLINNAGFGTFGPIETFTLEQVQSLYEVNVLGVLRMNRAVLPHMRHNGSGYVIYISSGLGRILLPFVGVYSSTKWALEALAETGSYELSPLGVDTTIVQPGAFSTDFGAGMISAADQKRLDSYGPVKEMAEQFAAGFAEREAGNPQEVADRIVELVAMKPGQRPLRAPVGADIAAPVGAINDTAAQVQAQVMQAMGGN